MSPDHRTRFVRVVVSVPCQESCSVSGRFAFQGGVRVLRSVQLGLPALRESGWSEGVEEGPVGFAGIQQGPDSVVVEVGEPEGGAFDAFDQVVGGYLEGLALWWFGAWVSCGRHVADGAGMRFWRRWPRCWARCSRSWWLSALSLVISSRAASRRCRSDSVDPRSGDGTGTVWAVATRRSRSMSARRSGWR